MADFPQWKGLFDWSMKYQDGTKVSQYTPGMVDPEKMKWLEGVLKHYMQDFAERMREIKAVLDDSSKATSESAVTATSADEGAAHQGPASLEEKETLLEELMEIVESIDYARDLHKIGGLPTLLDLLESPHPSLRWRAAEVVATCMANNPPVQQWFLDGGMLPRVLGLLSDPDTTCCVKGVLALSAMVRHHRPSLEAVRVAGGLSKLLACLELRERRLSRKVMSVLQYMFTQHRPDCAACCRFGLLPHLMEALEAEDSDTRQASLSALVELGRTPDSWALVREVPGIVARLHALLQQHSRLSAEDQDAQREEAGLASQLLQLLTSQQPPEAPPSESDHVEEDVHSTGAQPTTLSVKEMQQKAAQQQQGQGQQLGLESALQPGREMGMVPVPCDKM